MLTINIKNDFSAYPGLRHCNLSDNSGEHFYHELLNKKFKEAYEANDKLTVIIDGTDGYAPSFIDEAFGNLIYDFSLDIVKKYLIIISTEEPVWIQRLEKDTYPKWEERRNGNMNPVVTVKHDPWFRIVNGSILQQQWEIPMN